MSNHPTEISDKISNRFPGKSDLLFLHERPSGGVTGLAVSVVPDEDLVVVVAELLHLDRLLRVGGNRSAML